MLQLSLAEPTLAAQLLKKPSPQITHRTAYDKKQSITPLHIVGLPVQTIDCHQQNTTYTDHTMDIVISRETKN